MRVVWRGIITSLSLPAMLPLMNLRIWLAFQAHCQLIHQYLQVLLSRDTLNPLIVQLIFVPGISPTQVQDLSFGLVEIMRLSWAHLSSLTRSLWMAFLPCILSTSLLTLVSFSNLLRVHATPLSMSEEKMLNNSLVNTTDT